MKLNHLNLVVTDVGQSVDFFERYFGFTCTECKGDNVIAILVSPDGFTLVLMTDKAGKASYPDAFHLGFMQERPGQVDELHGKLVAGGIEVREAPRKIRDSYGFYFHFDNLMIEVGHYFTEAPQTAPL